MAGPTSAEEYKLISSFEAVRKTLLDQRFADRLDKPLAYWALPNDRRLPLAFLGRSVGDLLTTPFSELTATRGVGQKKISSLVKLLHRATSSNPPSGSISGDDAAETEAIATNGKSSESDSAEFDPATVSEVRWDQWRQVLSNHQVAHETLGRLCGSLQMLPTVIWHTKLNEYLKQSLGGIRQLRTHGEKRVTVVLEIVHMLQQIIHVAEKHRHLAVEIAPAFARRVEDWIDRRTSSQVLPDRDQVESEMVVPLMEQIETDAGQPVRRLAESRLGVNCEQKSVRILSKEMGVTRARVYQLLEDCARVMQVRWPAGREILTQLSELFPESEEDSPSRRLIEDCVELFYPTKAVKLAPIHGDDVAPMQELQAASRV